MAELTGILFGLEMRKDRAALAGQRLSEDVIR